MTKHNRKAQETFLTQAQTRHQRQYTSPRSTPVTAGDAAVHRHAPLPSNRLAEVVDVFEADAGTGECEHGFVDVGAAGVSAWEVAVGVQPGDRSLGCTTPGETHRRPARTPRTRPTD